MQAVNDKKKNFKLLMKTSYFICQVFLLHPVSKTKIEFFEFFICVNIIYFLKS